MPSALDWIGTVEAFKELGEGVGTMKPKKETVIDEMQPATVLLESGVKEILFKEAHEHVSIGRGHSIANDCCFTLK